MESASSEPNIIRTDLTLLVRRATGYPALIVGDWRSEALEPGLGEASGGVYRVTGSGHDGVTEIPWSLVLKIVTRPKNISASSVTHFYGDDVFAEPESLMYWKREALAYRSGLLDNLPPGLRAPRCYGVEEHGETDVWIWLEHVTDRSEQHWSLERYAAVVYELGRFNGAYLMGRTIPSAPWLAGDWLRRHVARAGPTFAELPRLLDHRVARLVERQSSIEG